jgi:Tol biopolymer transport system component
LCARAALFFALLIAALVAAASSVQSASGDLLLFMSSYDPRGSEWSVMDTASRLSYRLLRDAAVAAWSPDGTRLAYLYNRDGRPTPYVLDFETGQTRSYRTDIPYIARKPQWSPDGTRLLLHDYGFPVAPLYVLWVEDGALENLRVLSAESYGWMPDGEGIFLSERGETRRLDLATGALEPFLPGVDPQWSPDGRWIAFEQVSLARATSQIALLDTQTGETRPVPIPAENALLHSWSPDGRWLMTTRIATLPRGGTQQTLYLVDPLTLEGRDLGEVNIYCAVEWSPDGRLTYTDQQGWFRWLDIERGESSLLFSRPESCIVYEWLHRRAL